MCIFEKIKLKNLQGETFQYRILGFPFFEYTSDHIETKLKLLCFRKKRKINKDNPVFYLKINTSRYYSLVCLQNWIDIVEKTGCDYYIISDNPKITESIKKNIIFPNDDIKIIKSCRSKFLRKIASKTANKAWENAALAHLTTFWHSKKIGAKHFWNIDADDTLFLAKPDIVKDLLFEVQNYAEKNQILVFSLDMWNSWTKYNHWTFGISYITNDYDWFNLFKKVNRNWTDNYRFLSWSDKSCVLNLDWYFTYLQKHLSFNLKTFYPENMRFIHYCDFGARRRDNGLCYWENGVIHYPLFESVLKDNTIAKMPIPKEIVKIPVNITEEESFDFYKNSIRKH